MLQVPAAHGAAATAAAQLWPAGQMVQTAWPPAENVPLLQATGAEAPSAHALPGGHAEHVLARPSEKVPAAQGSGITDPRPLHRAPAGQARQAMVPLNGA